MFDAATPQLLQEHGIKQQTVFSAESVGKECYCTSGRLSTTLPVKYYPILSNIKALKEILWLD